MSEISKKIKKRGFFANAFDEFRRISRDPVLLFAILAVIITLFVFIILPLYEVFKQSFRALDGSFSFNAYINAFKSSSNVIAI